MLLLSGSEGWLVLPSPPSPLLVLLFGLNLIILRPSQQGASWGWISRLSQPQHWVLWDAGAPAPRVPPAPPEVPRAGVAELLQWGDEGMAVTITMVKASLAEALLGQFLEGRGFVLSPLPFLLTGCLC